MNRTLQSVLHAVGMAEHPDRAPIPRSPKWTMVRAAYLKAHPTCEACGARTKLQFHHIWPYSWPGGKELELEPQNLITLCEPRGRGCHILLGHNLDYRSRNGNVVMEAARQLSKIRNREYPEPASRHRLGEFHQLPPVTVGAGSGNRPSKE